VSDALLGAAGACGVALLLGTSRATDRSAGAVDNGTGLVAALATVDALSPTAAVGVIFPDAEEYGLVGSRALLRERAHLLADTSVVNFDGIDDRGPTFALVHRRGPLTERLVAGLGARRARWLPVLVDGIMLGRAARESVTVMRGDWRTACAVHSPRDTAARLTLAGVAGVARAVAAALGRG
jgi:Zn-dependent M28 family amino/carboxypeptidase